MVEGLLPAGSVSLVTEIRPSNLMSTGDVFVMYCLRTSSWVSRVMNSVSVGLHTVING